MSSNSIWISLRNPTFRRLWIATVISGCCVSAHDTAATWMMHTVSGSPFLISLMSTLASLPFFLFTVPAGALADMVDRRRILSVMNLWLASTAGMLAIFGALGALNPWIILVAVFCAGAGFSFYAPAWSALVPELVAPAELPSAVTLGGLQLNISGIIGPAVGGFLLTQFGAPVVFALNAFCFLLVTAAVLSWRRSNLLPRLPLENFFEAFVSAVRYVRYAPGIQVILVRDVVFSVFISVIPALLPVVGLRVLNLDSRGLGWLYTSMGIGSVLGAVLVIPQARARLSANTLTIVANVIVACVFVLMALVTDTRIFLLIAALAGLGWTLTAAELWVAGQRAMPNWARGRMNATHMMVSQGGIALGGLIWGGLAATAGVQFALLAAALLLLFSLPLAFPLSIDFTRRLDLEPAPLSTHYHRTFRPPEPSEGPVVVAMEFEIAPTDRWKFLRLMREMRLTYLRNGAFRWQLDEDLEKPNYFRMEMLVNSWAEHLQQHERMTKNEFLTWQRIWRLHQGKEPVVKHYLSRNRELMMRRNGSAQIEDAPADDLEARAPLRE
ncbi:MAG TPA: MFS transporter [Chthoniobacterales bacterium]|nr:MFS transporter [Chthoniobacterales bacterium]